LHQAIEIHDSDLAEVFVEKDLIRRFTEVILFESEGEPGVDFSTIWTQAAFISIAATSVHNTFTHWPVSLPGGYLKIDGVLFDNMIPLPLDQAGEVELWFEGLDCETLHITGTHIQTQLIGQPKYLEVFPPD